MRGQIFFIRGYWTKWDAEIDNLTLPALTGILTVTDPSGRSKGVPYLGNTYNLLTQYSQKVGASHRLTGGLNYRHNTLSSTQITRDSQENRLGLYFQEEWRPSGPFSVAAGARVDLHSEINPTVSPRVALFYSPLPDHTFRLAASLGSRPPTLNETNSKVITVTTLFGMTTTNTGLGSSNLRPELMISYEAGYQGWFFQHRVRIRADLFYNDISDFILPVATSPTTGTHINQGDAEIYGVESGIEFLATSWLRGFANTSYQQIDQTFTGQNTRGGPQWKTNVGLRGNWANGFSGEVVMHFVGSAAYPVRPEYSTFAGLGVIPTSAIPDTKVESYTLINLRGGYRFWQDRAEVAISVSNALNDRHREHPLGDVIGSRILGWLTINYN